MRALLCLALTAFLTTFLTGPTGPAAEPATPAITLITGDAVTLAGGGAVRVRAAAGREDIPITTFRDNGDLFVVPADAGRLIAADRVDRRLFDVTELVRLGYHDDPTIPVIANGRPARAGKGAGWQSLASGKLWLDGKRRVSLDQTVPRIGAPAAWQAGFTGAGVLVAVIDTGVDESHPDLAGQEAGQVNLGPAPDNVDRIGHGTHVASTIAGTGAKYHGVAAGARLLDVKVFDDDGWAQDSDIVAGLHWAAEHGAKIANLSLGNTDTPGTDPVEAAVEEVSAGGMLVVAAAGNSYRPETIGSPASADAALAVGAVDKSDVMADLSSRGPRLGDGAVKPDLVAPGIDVTAAKAGGGYVAMSGTSMAAPHVSGAAALLAQEHPTWTGQRLKAALVASAAPIAGTEYDRGAGRVDVARAITQTVTSLPANLGLGLVAWPHTRDVSRELAYRNDGAADVTLALSATGGFTVDIDRVTVPAGGTATVSVHAPTSPEDGPKSGLVTATGGDTRVVTPVSVLHEPKSHHLTINMVNPDGTPATDYFFKIASLDRQWADFAYDPSGRFTLWLPEGHYLIDSDISSGDSKYLLSAPDVPLTSDTTLSFDARTAKPVTITPPMAAERRMFDYGVATYRPGTRPFYFSTDFPRGSISSAHVGPVPPRGVATSWFSTHWVAGADSYRLAYFWDGRVPTGFVRAVEDVATVRVRMDLTGAGTRWVIPQPRGGFASVFPGAVTMYEPEPVDLPGRFVEHVNAEAEWLTGVRTDDLALESPAHAYRAGRTYDLRFGGAVYGPVLPPTPYPTPGVTRSDGYLTVDVPMFGDAAGNAGWGTVTAPELHLYRAGVEIQPSYGVFPLPPGRADYRLTASATREAQVSTAVDVAWTFHSGADGRVPVSVVRFTPALTGDTAPHGRFAVPVALQHADGSLTRPRHLTVNVSYDEGRTWRPTITRGDQVILTHPAGARTVSLRAWASDGDTTVEQTIIRAYLLQ